MTDTPHPPHAGDRLVASPVKGGAVTESRPRAGSGPAVPRPHRPARPGGKAVTPWRRVVTALAALVRLAARVAALSVLLYAIFTVLKANPANVWYQFVETLASSLSLGLANLFQFADPRWTTLVNYGLAALVWLIIGSAVAGLIRRTAD